MKKIIIFIFMLSNILLFAENYFINGKTVSLDMVEFDKKSYIVYNDLEKFGLRALKYSDRVSVSKPGLLVIFFLREKKITVNETSFSLNNSYKLIGGKTYLSFDFLSDLLGYKKVGNAFKTNSSYKSEMDSKAIPKKVISLSPAVTEKLFAIGAGDMLVGRTVYCHYPKKALAIDSIGTMFDPKLEIILSKKPDLVIAETHFNPKTLKILNKFGIESIVLDSLKNLDEIYKSILNLGKHVGKPYESKALVYSLRQKVTEIEDLAERQKTKPRVYFVLGSGKTEHTAGKGTFISEMIRMAGGKNIADDVIGWAYSPEKLVSNNPEIIFGTKKYVDMVVKKYPTLDAVKKGNYFYVDENSFVLPGPRALSKGIETMFNIFHTKLKVSKR